MLPLQQRQYLLFATLPLFCVLGTFFASILANWFCKIEVVDVKLVGILVLIFWAGIDIIRTGCFDWCFMMRVWTTATPEFVLVIVAHVG